MTITRRELLRAGGAALVLAPVSLVVAIATVEATPVEVFASPASRLLSRPSPGKCGECGDHVRPDDAVLYCRWCADKVLLREDEPINCGGCDAELDDQDGKCETCVSDAERTAREEGEEQGRMDAEDETEARLRKHMDEAFEQARQQLYGIRDDLRDRGMDARYWMRLDDVIATMTTKP